MAKHHPLIRIAEMAISFVEADGESGAKIESQIQTMFNRYPSEKEGLLKIWHDLVRYVQKHKCEKPEEPLTIDEALWSLVR